METSFDVVVIGAVGIDTNIYVGNELDLSEDGNFAEVIDYIGQAGGYSSQSFTRLGCKTALLAAFGDDYHRDHITDNLQNQGIIVLPPLHDTRGTKRSVNFVFPDGHRYYSYDGKNSMETIPNVELYRTYLQQARLAHINIVNWSRHFLPLLKECGVVISVDLQDVRGIDDPYRQDFVNYADILFFSDANLDDPITVAKHYLSLNQDLVIVIGMGKKGAMLITNDNKIREGPADLDLPVIDTNGAGDSLAAGFLTSYFHGSYSLTDSLLRGQINARFTCSLKATSSSMLTLDQLDEYYGQQKRE